MPEEPGIDERLRAVERALTGTDRGPAHLEEAGDVTEQLADLTSRVDSLEADVEELAGAVDALRGYVGHIDHVNEAVERRANAAIATVERLESAPNTPPRLATAQNPDRSAGDFENRQGTRTADPSPAAGAAPGGSADAPGEAVAEPLQMGDESPSESASSRLRSLLDRLAELG
ncbi:MAG: hypothetical protein ABEI31_05215 [Halodesulfurarchaeum sp.]